MVYFVTVDRCFSFQVHLIFIFISIQFSSVGIIFFMQIFFCYAKIKTVSTTFRRKAMHSYHSNLNRKPTKYLHSAPQLCIHVDGFGVSMRMVAIVVDDFVSQLNSIETNNSSWTFYLSQLVICFHLMLSVFIWFLFFAGILWEPDVRKRRMNSKAEKTHREKAPKFNRYEIKPRGKKIENEWMAKQRWSILSRGGSPPLSRIYFEWHDQKADDQC